MKTILKLDHNTARQFFLKQKSYCTIELPEYFVFQNLLNSLSKEVKSNKLDLCAKKRIRTQQQKAKFIPIQPNEFDDVNHTLYYNKDGKFAWRPLQLINPALYVFLVHKITEESNWNFIVERFTEFQENHQIRCCSIPVMSEEDNKSDKADTITNWWNQIEQQSLELALEYTYFLNTDIIDCYGAIYTHTIPWALHDKDRVKANIAKAQKDREKLIGDEIDTTIQSTQYAQTNGIPQGSVLMDFIAEMVLGYADLLLFEKINDAKIDDYQILRYRDDYRIFTNNQEDATHITKLLTEVLIGLNLRLNSQKTFLSVDVIADSIKADKLYWIGAKKGERTLQKTLLLIHLLAGKYPNSGSLTKALSDFQKRLYKKQSLVKENVKVLISIIVDIAYKNPKTYPMVVAILSKLLSFLNDNNEISATVLAIEKKFNKIPNVGHLMVWLQRLTLKIDKDKNYEENLCKKVVDNSIAIWNIDWLNDKIKKVITDTQIIDNDYIVNMDAIMKPEEVQLFNTEY
jgi:hypothetical protein